MMKMQLHMGNSSCTWPDNELLVALALAAILEQVVIDGLAACSSLREGGRGGARGGAALSLSRSMSPPSYLTQC